MLATQTRQQSRTLYSEPGQMPRPMTRPRITPNMGQVSKKFPALGFTIDTAGLEYFEVLLTTDRSLFDPASAGRRQAQNFYASREHSGLIKAMGGSAVYLVPPAVLNSFVQTQPRPSSIYYTAIAYHGPDGREPVFAHPPEMLPTEAPTVAIAADFQSQSFSSVLGIAISRLQRVGPPSNGAALDKAAGNGYRHVASPEMAVDAETDAAEGEDGFNQNVEPPAPQAQAYTELQALPDLLAEEDVPHNGHDAAPMCASPRSTPAEPGVVNSNGVAKRATTSSMTSETPDAALDYDDGYGAMPEESSWWSESQAGDYPPGTTEPEALEDDEASSEREAYEEEDNNEMEEPETDGKEVDDHEHDDGALEKEAPPTKAIAKNYDDADSLKMDNASDDDGEAYGVASSGYVDEAAALDWDEPELAYESLDDSARPRLTIDDKLRIIAQVAQFESASGGYSAINADGEFEGRFGTSHPAYHRYHVGLSYGIVQFTQDSGGLGRLLIMMRDRDRGAFNRIFGSAADELIRVTTASGPFSKNTAGGRSARVQPVAGVDLWREPWLAGFREAGRHRLFQAAQNELAARMYIDSILPFPAWLGLDTMRALTMVVDRSVQLGPGGARQWIIDAVGPIQTPAQRQQALQALGHSDLRSFQQATSGLEADNKWGAMTHAAMVAALRKLGSASPIPIPTREQMLEAMVRRAETERRRWAHRLRTLRDSSELADTPLQLL